MLIYLRAGRICNAVSIGSIGTAGIKVRVPNGIIGRQPHFLRCVPINGSCIGVADDAVRICSAVYRRRTGLIKNDGASFERTGSP